MRKCSQNLLTRIFKGMMFQILRLNKRDELETTIFDAIYQFG